MPPLRDPISEHKHIGRVLKVAATFASSDLAWIDGNKTGVTRK